jgi:hypothetical protein
MIVASVATSECIGRLNTYGLYRDDWQFSLFSAFIAFR